MAPRSKTTTAKKSARTSSAKASDTVASARQIADKAARAAGAANEAIDSSVAAASKGATEFNRKCIDFAKANMDASFELATALAACKTPVDAMQLQAEFMRRQYEAMTAQSRELADLAGLVARGAGNPFAELASKSGWPLPGFGQK